MKDLVLGLLLGALFGFGLALSGMTDPAVVLGFLDPLGDWNPALAFVMGGALVVTFVLFRLARRQNEPFAATRFHWPAATAVDGRLLGGAALFGLGWGLAGYCPGPALASLSAGHSGTLVFLGAMLAGMMIVRALSQPRAGIRVAARP
jgi:uncharacterized membrane protein YedE/YeeE